MTTKIQKKLKRMEEMLENKHTYSASRETSNAKTNSRPFNKENFVKRLQYMRKKDDLMNILRPSQKMRATYDSAVLRERLFPPQPSEPVEVFLPDQTIKSSFYLNTLRSNDSETMASPREQINIEKKVSFSLENPEIFTFIKYSKDPNLEYVSDIKEFEEMRYQQQLFRDCLEIVRDQSYNSLGKLEAALEREIGNKRKHNIEVECGLHFGFHETNEHLMEMSNALSKEIENLNKSLFKQNNDMIESVKSSVSIKDITLPKCERKLGEKRNVNVNNSDWLLTWTNVEENSEKIKSVINDEKSLPSEYRTQKLEMKESVQTLNEESKTLVVPTPLKSALKKTKHRKPHQKVKFDASSLKNESRRVQKYTLGKLQEYREGNWLKKLNSIFQDQEQTLASTRLFPTDFNNLQGKNILRKYSSNYY